MLTVPGSRMASSRTSLVAVSYRRSIDAQRLPSRVDGSFAAPMRVGTLSCTFSSYPRPDAEGPGQADARRHRGALGRALGGRRHLPLRPGRARRRDRAEVFVDRHPAAHGVGLDPHGQRLRLHPDRLPSPATSGCAARPSSTRSAGTTTGWPPSGACRTSTACAATRRSHYDPEFQPPYRGDTPSGHQEVPISRPNFVELCHELTATDEAVFEETVPAPRPVLRLVAAVHDDQRRQPAHQPARVPAQPRPRRGLQRRGADALGRRRPHGRRPGRDRGPRAPGRLPPARLPRARRRRPDRHDPPRAGRQLRRAGRPPRRRALPRRCSGRRCARRCSASRCPSSPTRSPSRTRAPASPWCARSATPPTSRGGASSTCRRAASSGATAGSPRRRPAWIPTERRTGRLRSRSPA